MKVRKKTLKKGKSYSTLCADVSGDDYRVIADRLTQAGDPMGHSTARNIFIRCHERLAAALMAQKGIVGDPSEVAKRPEFQQSVAFYLESAYRQLDEERWEEK